MKASARAEQRPNVYHWVTPHAGNAVHDPGSESSTTLAAYTARVRSNVTGSTRLTVAPGSVIPAEPGGSSPIKHIIYVMKENRTP